MGMFSVGLVVCWGECRWSAVFYGEEARLLCHKAVMEVLID